MEIVTTNGTDKRFVFLCNKLDEFLYETVGEEKQRSQYDKHNTLKDINHVILALIDGEPAGCASFKKHSDSVAEIKRVYVSTNYHGMQLGKTIMNSLEQLAKANGYKKLILETGIQLKPAINMYKSLGYKIIDNYEPFIGMEDSICMEKAL